MNEALGGRVALGNARVKLLSNGKGQEMVKN